MTTVRLDDISKAFQHHAPVLRDVSLTCPAGKITVILGPSGCGKSTLLRLVAGLDEPTSGRVWFDDRDMTRTPPHDRGVSMVFQNAALYPHMTARQNIAFTLTQCGLRGTPLDERLRAAAEMLRLTDNLLDRRPGSLSGGERQRVAIAKAVAAAPRVLLMDEPLSSLDTDLRRILRTEIKSLQQRLGVTTLFVTHDADEAACLADHTVRLAAAAAAV